MFNGPIITLRVQVPNNHIFSHNIELLNYYPKPKYLIIGSFGPLGLGQEPLEVYTRTHTSNLSLGGGVFFTLVRPAAEQ